MHIPNQGRGAGVRVGAIVGWQMLTVVLSHRLSTRPGSVVGLGRKEVMAGHRSSVVFLEACRGCAAGAHGKHSACGLRSVVEHW